MSSVARRPRLPPIRRPLALRAAAAGHALLGASLAAAAILLALAARLPLAFEDSYHHWMLAAALAQSGRLHDPLFGMEDTWLPGYHVLAAGVLKVAGLWNLGALRGLSMACALATLGLLFGIAGGGRRGTIAVLLVACNPVFLLTATSVVAEPLLGLCLLAATGAALRGRPWQAAVLATAACLVGTKAWLWLLLAAVAILLDRAGARARLAWILPGLAIALGLEAALSPAGHSLVRSATEAASAAARGSLPGSSLTRGYEFLGYFALASLPAVALAPLGFLKEVRDPGARDRLLLLHLPTLLYLAAIATLVAAGASSGSHRYLYLALPGLGLLAATALEPAGRPLLTLAVLAPAGFGAALVAVSFVPVLESFGRLDSGLARAGQVASAQPGGLLTDSPAAAYWSGKPVAAIHGSRELPSDPDAAVAYLRSRGIRTLVLEDISYYRVNTVFVGLAAGHALPPFERVGDPGAFTVPGGKQVAVYTIGSGLRFLRNSEGAGKTRGLARGAVLEMDGRALGGEGVGFGVPLLRYPDGDWFSGTATVSDLGMPGQPGWRTVYSLDRRGIADDTSFANTPSRGRVEVEYRVQGGRLAIQVRPLDLAPGFSEMVLMNEQAAVFDDYADPAQTRLGGAIGSWTPVAGGWGRFRSSAVGLEWSLPALPAAGFHAAREVRVPDIDFSGLEYSFGPGFTGVTYTITVGAAR